MLPPRVTFPRRRPVAGNVKLASMKRERPPSISRNRTVATSGIAPPPRARAPRFQRCSSGGSFTSRAPSTAAAAHIPSGCQSRNASDPAIPARNHLRRTSSASATTISRTPGVFAPGPPSASCAKPWNDAHVTAPPSPAERALRAALERRNRPPPRQRRERRPPQLEAEHIDRDHGQKREHEEL